MRGKTRSRWRRVWGSALIVALLTSLMAPLPVAAQDEPVTAQAAGTVHGTVTNADTGMPIEDAWVVLENYEEPLGDWFWIDYRRTDQVGGYEFEVLWSGKFRVSCSARGYFSSSTCSF